MSNRGQVLIETALMLPLLLLLLLGGIDFSRAMYAKNSLNNAARSGARAASVQRPAPTAVIGTLSSPGNDVERAISGNLFNGVDTASVTYQLRIFDAAGTAVTRPAQTGDHIQVTVSWPDFTMFTPMISRIYKPSLSGEASMRYE